jgi:hypothetical protein
MVKSRPREASRIGIDPARASHVGPGLIFLESGYQWSRLENEDVELLAGGVLLEAGYRFRF